MITVVICGRDRSDMDRDRVCGKHAAEVAIILALENHFDRVGIPGMRAIGRRGADRKGAEPVNVDAVSSNFFRDGRASQGFSISVLAGVRDLHGAGDGRQIGRVLQSSLVNVPTAHLDAQSCEADHDGRGNRECNC
jgi:hypothetical protein